MLEFQESHVFVFRDTAIDQLSEQAIASACERGFWVDSQTILLVRPVALDVDAGTFACRLPDGEEATVVVLQENGQVVVSSDLHGLPGTLTPAAATVLTAILRREELGVFFRLSLRRRKLQQAAVAYGLEHEPDLDRYLAPVFAEGRLTIQPRMAGLLPLTSPKLRELEEQVERHQNQQPAGPPAAGRTIAVISRHKYYRNPVVELVDAERTKSGNLKPPFTRIEPLELLAAAADVDEAKFYAAIVKLQQVREGDRSTSDLEALRVVLKYGRGYPFYYHDESLGGQFATKTLVPVKMATVSGTVRLAVRAAGAFYAVTGIITLEGTSYALHELPLKFGCFFLLKDTLYLVDNALLLSVMALMKENGGKLLIHASKYRDFQRRLLDKLSDSIRVEYPDVKLGTPQQLAEMGFAATPGRLIYLSDFGQHVMIIPVVRYGEAEVAVRTEKQVKAVDGKGDDFMVARDADFEQTFIELLIKQHPYLPEQLDNQLYYFYLHKKYFLDEEWFLPVFDTWLEADIEVYGFNELSGNKLNPHKVTIDIKVISGLNWFNATHDVRFGKKKASLKKIQAALRNKSKYVALDDGTVGILPQEWIEKFARYFQAGEVVDEETIRFAKSNFETVTALYDAAMLDEAAVAEIREFRERLTDFESIPSVDEPSGLRVKLRPYQRQGLNWLSFLDRFNFGGILADEMGLGKTVQVIAFMLSQRVSGRTGADLVVVPATLVFNWQRELATSGNWLQWRLPSAC